MRAEVGFVPVPRQRQTLARSGEVRPLREPVVLDESHEHAGQQPMDRGLGDDSLTPCLVRFAGSFGITGRLPFGLQFAIKDQLFRDANAEIPFQGSKQTLEIAEEAV